MAYDWPGNVRQLENIIKQFVIFQSESILEKSLLSIGDNPRKAVPTAPKMFEDVKKGALSLKEVSKQATLKAERELIAQVLRQTDWNRTETAKILQISYKSLLNKIKESDLDKQA